MNENPRGMHPLTVPLILRIIGVFSVAMLLAGADEVRGDMHILVIAFAACLVVVAVGVMTALNIKMWRMPKTPEPKIIERHVVHEGTTKVIDNRAPAPDVRVLNVPQVPGMDMRYWPTLIQGAFQQGQLTGSNGKAASTDDPEEWGGTIE